MSTTVLSLMDTQAISLSFFIDEADWQGKFTHLEVWRSEEGAGGPYTNMLSSSWAPARLPVQGGEPSNASGGLVNIVGKTLELLLNESISLSYVFTGTDPISRADCATQLSAAYPMYLSAHVDAVGRFVVQTQQVGSVASLRVLEGDAAAMLGLPTGEDDLVHGKDVLIPLLPGVVKYSFRDPFGRTDYFYKTRLYNAQTLEASAPSAPVSGAVRVAIDPTQLAVGYLQLMGLDGRALKDREVLLFNSYKASQIAGFTIVNEGQKKLTDANGYVEFVVVRGTAIDVAIPGTSLMQRVAVPTDTAVTRFNLLDPAYGNNDAFAVQRVDFPYAERRTL